MAQATAPVAIPAFSLACLSMLYEPLHLAPPLQQDSDERQNFCFRLFAHEGEHAGKTMLRMPTCLVSY